MSIKKILTSKYLIAWDTVNERIDSLNWILSITYAMELFLFARAD